MSNKIVPQMDSVGTQINNNLESYISQQGHIRMECTVKRFRTVKAKKM